MEWFYTPFKINSSILNKNAKDQNKINLLKYFCCCLSYISLANNIFKMRWKPLFWGTKSMVLQFNQSMVLQSNTFLHFSLCYKHSLLLYYSILENKYLKVTFLEDDRSFQFATLVNFSCSQTSLFMWMFYCCFYLLSMIKK